MTRHRNTYFSAGEYCATAHQIRRVTGMAEAYFFDWLITRDDDFRFLVAPDDELLKDDGWDIVERSIRLRDRGTGLLFQHEFERDAQGAIDPARVPQHLPLARQKFIYLKHKLVDALKSCDNPVLVRAENGLTDQASVLNRLAQLRATFDEVRPDAKIVLASTQLRQEEVSNDHLALRLDNPVPAAGPDAWKGDDASWSRLFELAEQHLHR